MFIKHLRDQIKFLIDAFVENGHDRNHILPIIDGKCNQK